MYTNDKRKKRIMLFCMMAMFLFAVSISMIGLVLPEVTKEFQVSLSKTGIVTAVQNAGGMIALALCGHLADRFGKLKVITGLFTAMTAALLGCFIIYRFPGFVLTVMMLGLAASALNACISAYLADLFPERRDYYISLAGVLFGLGSVLGPVYVGSVGKQAGGWRNQFGAVGIAGGITLLLFILLAGRRKQPGITEPAPVQENKKQGGRESVLKQKRLWFYGVIGFLYMAHSSSFMAWIPTCLAARYPADLTMGNRVMTVYWISILAGRIFSTWKADKLTFNRFMLWSNGIGGLGMLLAICMDGWALTVVYGVVGIATGAVFQVCLAGTCKEFAHISGRASSMVALAASIGGTLSCYITGLIAQSLGFTAVLVFLGALLLLIVPIILFNQHKGQ
ncbi:MFS transporter [Parablautia intestinalis]|uniref:MFS transporter n=1 Tax=Parablautia intestinalis TaxID=2320100 RepID=A0A3A9AIK7_9FIRM|nr:MFS transporter [Parablautia intestinalis]RKI91302.1 MFS transporter [Parablautia intestinalis]